MLLRWDRRTHDGSQFLGRLDECFAELVFRGLATSWFVQTIILEREMELKETGGGAGDFIGVFVEGGAVSVLHPIEGAGEVGVGFVRGIRVSVHLGTGVVVRTIGQGGANPMIDKTNVMVT